MSKYIRLDKEKFLKHIARNKEVPLWWVKEAIEAYTTPLEEDRGEHCETCHANGNCLNHCKPTQEEKPACCYYHTFGSPLVPCKPTPEPEECKHDWITKRSSLNNPEAFATFCQKCGKVKPKSKVPEKLDRKGSDIYKPIGLLEKINEILEYLRTKDESL